MPVIDANGISLHYEEQGNPDHPTIVLAHPMLFGSEVFDGLAAELVDDFHLVRPHLHGHGRSGYRTPLTIDDITADFDVWLRTLKRTRVVWVGYSIGGMIGMRLALRQPNAIGALVLIAATASAEPPELRAATTQLWELFGDGHREDIVDSALQFFFSPATYAEQPELIARHRKDVVERGDVAGIVAAANAVLDRPDLLSRIGDIDVRTMVIAGRDDIGAAGPGEAEAIAARIPGAKLAIVERASHLLAVEQPRELNALVRAFVRSPAIAAA